MTNHEEQDAATEAAQNVADEVKSSWHSSTDQTVREELDKGLDEANVDMPDSERESLVSEIKDEGDRSPEVHEASPGE